MFAAAIWDKPQKRLLLYRDRLGKKPLYYAQTGEVLIFGSEIKSLLLHPRISRELDFTSIYHYLGLKNTQAPRTIYRDIRQILPGEYLIWEKGRLSTKKYWNLNFNSIQNISDEEAAEEILRILEDAVRLRMDCDVPYGAYLSGGVDSSSITTLMTRFSSKPIKTFCLVYEGNSGGEGKEGDRRFARDISRRLGTEHHEFLLTPEFFRDKMPDVLNAFDEPFSGTISTFFLSILIHQYVKVAISGDGADELFGSYLAHRLAFPIRNYNQFRAQNKSSWKELNSEERGSLFPFDSREQYEVLTRVADPDLATWRLKLNVFTPEELEQLLAPEVLKEVSPAGRNPYALLSAFLTAHDDLNRVLEMDQREVLPNQVLPFVDRLSMAHSIEVRVPFLDYRLVEFVNSLPGSMKIKEGVNKYIHKAAMEKILPEDIINRPKEGFVQPNYLWMHASLKGWVLEKLRTLPKKFFNASFLGSLISRFERGETALNAKIWGLTCLSLWWGARRNP
jgi:asparagine synthase (glutamine-hydrolysing)